MQDPAFDFYAITPSDTVPLDHPARSLYVGFGGHVTAISLDGTTATHYNVQDGSILPIQVLMVLATGTTASGILGYRN